MEMKMKMEHEHCWRRRNLITILEQERGSWQCSLEVR